MLVPKLRFPGFEDEWQVVKLGDIAHFSKGAGVSKSDIDLSGSREAIRYGELYTIYGEVVGDVHSKIIPSERDVLSEDNDVLIPSSGETAIDISTATYVGKNGVAVGGDLNIIRTNKSGRFLSYLLNHGKKLDVARLAQGVSVVHLYASELKGLQIEVPAKEEQEKIADFLMVVDERVELQSNKVKKLEIYKRGLIQKIFSRQVRFRRDDGSGFSEWSSLHLKDITEYISSDISTGNIESRLGAFPVFGANGFIKNIDTFQTDRGGSAIVKDGAGVGRIIKMPKVGSVVSTLGIMRSKAGNDENFIHFVLGGIRFEKYITGSTIPHVYYSDYSREKVSVPEFKEQQKIATLLSQIDEKITLETKKLEGLKKFKKSLLQRMFV